MIEGHGKVGIQSFLGIYNRKAEDTIPDNHFSDALNMKVSGDEVVTREGSQLAFSKADILRTHVFKKSGEAVRHLILTTSGSIYDSVSLSVPILTIVGMVDFSVVTLFNRCYISPHDRTTGVSGQKVYVYTGTGSARPAAGTAPTGFTLVVADSVLSGNVEAGLWLFGVAFETESGFITAPGPTEFTQFTSAGEKRLALSTIPIGPTGTVARHIVCTKLIEDYDGNQDGQDYYFAYNGRIDNNLDTTVTLDFFDAQLVESANYLFDQLAEIPAALGLTVYDRSLVTWGENSYPSIVRCSKQGEPESFNGEIGYALIDPNDGSGVKSVVEYRGQLFLLKPNRTRAVQRASGYEIGLWEIVNVDNSIGTEVYGISQILDTRGSVVDYFLVLTKTGLFAFDGTYNINLAHKVHGLWETINQQYIGTSQVYVDSIKRRIYCAVPTGSAQYPNKLFVADYSTGFAAESVQWHVWSFPVNPRSITLDVDYTTRRSVFYFASDNIMKLVDEATDDAGVAIDSYVKFSNVAFTNDDSLSTLVGIRARLFGSGSLFITASGLDDVNPTTYPAITLSSSPGKVVTKPLNNTSERFNIKLRTFAFGSWFRLRYLYFFGSPYLPERPQ